jgi:DMSO/TMAO reductase YedYZ heme-binding membrane subunit
MNPRSNSSLPKPGPYGIATGVVVALIPVIVLIGGTWLTDFLNFGAGVLSLVSLSCSVIWGLVAQDRIFLTPMQRIVGQAVHRTLGVAAIAFLLLHISTKLALEHTVLLGALIPFSLGITGIGGLIGCGSLAAMLMIFVGITGALRSQFASPAEVAARWRAMHMLAYPAWCLALIHGLYAGRTAKPIFFILYSLSLAGVIAALALRASPRSFKRKVADRIQVILGPQARGGLDALDASRARNSETLAGFESKREREPNKPRAAASFDTPAPSAASADAGFGASYRASAPTTRIPAQPSYGAGAGAGSGSGAGSWPIPSPPPVGEAPPSAYDPLQDTGFTIPAYQDPAAGNVVRGDVSSTGQMNAVPGTYAAGDTYSGAPAANRTPGESFDSPGAGESWNTPSGGYR